MRTDKLFADKAALYAQARPSYPNELFDFIASLCTEKKVAWDCATGNGQAAQHLSQVFERVEATDISEEQISNGFGASNISYSVQTAERTSFKDNQFDLVSVAQALHWFDYERFWPEVSRVLKPDGVFVTFAYNWHQVQPEIDTLVQKHLLDIIDDYWPPQNQLLWDGYRNVDFPFVPLKAPAINLTCEWNANQFLQYLHTWSATRLCMQDIGMAFFEVFSAELKKAWGDHEEVKTITSPLVIIAGKNWS